MSWQINTVKYDANREITNIYENLQIVWSQFCTNLLLFIYIRSTSNISLFIGIQICCQWIQTNSYLVTFSYSQYLIEHSMSDPEGRKTTICRYLNWTTKTLTFWPFVWLFAVWGIGMAPIDFSFLFLLSIFGFAQFWIKIVNIHHRYWKKK